MPGVKSTPTLLVSHIISLYVFPFLATPLLTAFAGNFFNDYEEFLEMRKKENVKTILTKLNLT